MSNMFETDNDILKLIADLAYESSDTDPIDWGDLNISEKEAYNLMAAHVAEIDLSNTVIAQSIITRLLVENFVLNLRLAGKQ
jgi:hypothetical protein